MSRVFYDAALRRAQQEERRDEKEVLPDDRIRSRGG